MGLGENGGKTPIRNPLIRGLIFLAVALFLSYFAAQDFLAMHEPDPIYPGGGVSYTKMLSDYFPALKGAAVDTEIYFLEGEAEGGTVLVLGGTHPNEPAAYVSPILLIERAIVPKGRLIIIPRANSSGFTFTKPGEASPPRYPLATSEGVRWFSYGARGTNPIHSWPDPDVYVNYPSGQQLSGEDARNLNRTFPGRPNGWLTERLAYGIMELIRQEKVDLTIDLHEAMPEFPNINVIVAHQNSMDVASDAQLDLLIAGMRISLSESPPKYRGLTHREIGDYSDSRAALLETPTICIGALRGRTTVETLVYAQDDFYVWGAELGRLFVPFTEAGWPIDRRIARHVTSILYLCEALGLNYPELEITIENVPSYDELLAGAGRYFHPPQN